MMGMIVWLNLSVREMIMSLMQMMMMMISTIVVKSHLVVVGVMVVVVVIVDILERTTMKCFQHLLA